MKRRVEQKRIEKFRQDRRLLSHNDAYIAQKMAMGKANFSSYMNGRYAISDAFLQRFYAAFADELNVIQNNLPEMTINERIAALENKVDEILKAQEEISQTILRLESQIDRLADIFFNSG
ncbi:MAG: hypothetical protein JST68_17695 [Bacteroidetes bacterium]|nr:hypothetical protein [Bacteroidota bacterium]